MVSHLIKSNVSVVAALAPGKIDRNQMKQTTKKELDGGMEKYMLDFAS